MSEINDTKEISEGNFPININLIKKNQRSGPSIIDKYKDGTYNKGYFCGGINIDLKLITFKDEVVIPSILQRYIVHWYHTYLLHPVMDRT